jgi:hypothetical protein
MQDSVGLIVRMTSIDHKNMSGRQLRRHLKSLLMHSDMAVCREALVQIPARRAINPLFAFLYDGVSRVRWRAVGMMGRVVANLAESDIESARVILRRLMWNLNDESGGIGWGSPEAMGEILACSEPLAEEFANILKSYIREDGNYLEHEGLQQGALWGVGRLAHVRPERTGDIAPALMPFLARNHTRLQGLALWAAMANRDPMIREIAADFVKDKRTVEIFQDDAFVEKTLGQLAARFLA